MEQMQTTSMLYMLQMAASRAEAAPRREAADKAEKPQSEDRDFQKLMNKARKDKEQPKAEDAPVDRPGQELPRKDIRTEEELLQELAAMQGLYVEAGGRPVMQMTQPEAQQTAAAVQSAEVVAAATGQQMAQQAAQPQLVQEGDQPVSETVTQMPQTQQPQQDNRQQADLEQRPQQGPQVRNEGIAHREMAHEEQVQVKKQSGETAEGEQNLVFGQVEAAPIKVSETAETQAPAAPQDVEAQIEEPVTEAIRQGDTRVEIRLEPQQLGKVTVELTRHEDGTIQVVLRAENSETRNLLEKDLPGLQQLLSRNSQQEVQVEVPRHQESQQQDLQDGHHRQNHQQQQQQQRRDGGEDFLSRLRLGLVTQEEEI